MATVYFDPASGWAAYALQSRTDAAGAAVDDVDGEELRTLLDAFYTAGVVNPAAGYQVVEDSPAGMTVVVGSGSAKTDHAVVAGLIVGQGNYLARLEDATVDLTVPAADLSNPRVDEAYLVVQDNAYDSSARVLPRLAYRDGTPASTPVAPGPDASWDAYLLLATIDVAAAATEIVNADITDERVFSTLEIASGGSAPTGSITAYGGVTIPDGWLLCNGDDVSRTTFARLFAAIGEEWGAGDGSTTFTLPFPDGEIFRGTSSPVLVGTSGGTVDSASGSTTLRRVPYIIKT